MSKVAAGVFFPCHRRFFPSGGTGRSSLNQGKRNGYPAFSSEIGSSLSREAANLRLWKGGSQQKRAPAVHGCTRVTMRMNGSHSASPSPRKPSTFRATISTDLPLFESPGASFDEYLGEKERVFRAMFPDKKRSRRLSDEEWRIQMLPLDFLFLSVRPVVDMRLRCISHGEDYPPGVPRSSVNRVMHLQATRWELGGLDAMVKPTEFSLGVQGILYSQRQGRSSRLRGQMEMSITCILPPALAFIPQDVLRGVSESVLRRLVDNMKQKVNDSLISDFSSFRRERLLHASSQPHSVSPAAGVTATNQPRKFQAQSSSNARAKKHFL